MKIIIGLGNPGKDYEATRHNAGYMAVDFLAEHFSCSEWSLKKKLQAFVCEGLINGEKIVFAKPHVYMNVSGMPVQLILNWYKTDPSGLIIIHDDTDLAQGNIKFQSDRGSAGHNGIASVISGLGTQQFGRIRVGVRPEGNTLPALELVLQRFSDEDIQSVLKTFPAIIDYIEKK